MDEEEFQAWNNEAEAYNLWLSDEQLKKDLEYEQK